MYQTVSDALFVTLNTDKDLHFLECFCSHLTFQQECFPLAVSLFALHEKTSNPTQLLPL